ncbi:hypothetical protein AGMMS49975_02730 [Clostridia bacterium]|nr:hypothetical protein AGMMS49975_02730 [Clostridia bacterium]
MFFTRHGLFDSEQYYRQYMKDICAQVNDDINWVSAGSEVINLTVEPRTYHALLGDTSAGIAKMYALMVWADGAYPIWDTYQTKVYALSGGDINIPAACIRTDDYTISALINRVYASVPSDLSLFINGGILNPLSTITAENVTYQSGSTIKDTLNFLSMEELINARPNFGVERSLTINNALTIPKNVIYDALKNTEVSGAASRFTVKYRYLWTEAALYSPIKILRGQTYTK